MIAREFAVELLAAVTEHGNLPARTFAEAGYTPCPHGVELTLPTGARLYLQAVTAPCTELTPGPVEGPPVAAWPPVELPLTGLTGLAGVERWLAFCLTASRSTRISEVRVFQDRRGRVAIPHGLAVRFHSGDRAWVYIRHATPAGREPQSMAVWRSQAEV